MKERRKINTHAEENTAFTVIKNIKLETNKNAKNIRRNQKSRIKWQNKSAIYSKRGKSWELEGNHMQQ